MRCGVKIKENELQNMLNEDMIFVINKLQNVDVTDKKRMYFICPRHVLFEFLKTELFIYFE